uniref:Uncharacterized protein n=1 Tax=Glossina austeni TaxID=7395 RepID=A0A1A9V3L1_GLOAU
MAQQGKRNSGGRKDCDRRTHHVTINDGFAAWFANAANNNGDGMAEVADINEYLYVYACVQVLLLRGTLVTPNCNNNNVNDNNHNMLRNLTSLLHQLLDEQLSIFSFTCYLAVFWLSVCVRVQFSLQQIIVDICHSDGRRAAQSKSLLAEDAKKTTRKQKYLLSSQWSLFFYLIHGLLMIIINSAVLVR